MKIDEACINHNVVRLISEMTAELYEFTNDVPYDDHARIAVLGEIRGICQMAEAMKEVLKA